MGQGTGPNRDSDPIDDGDSLSDGFTQNTGNVDVTFNVTHESSSHIDHEFYEEQFVGGIDDGSENIDDDSGLISDLTTDSDGRADYELEFLDAGRERQFPHQRHRRIRRGLPGDRPDD